MLRWNPNSPGSPLWRAKRFFAKPRELPVRLLRLIGLLQSGMISQEQLGFPSLFKMKKLALFLFFILFNKQIFAGKYLNFLPSEEELEKEIEKERKLIENRLMIENGKI